MTDRTALRTRTCSTRLGQEVTPALRQQPGVRPSTLEVLDVPDRTCSIDGCTSQVYARGFCRLHDGRRERYGHPLALPPRPSPLERFFAKVEVRADGCWMWTGAKTGAGYASFRGPNGTVNAHRWAYLTLFNPALSPELHLDHLCHTLDPGCVMGPSCPHRSCVNPAHLEPVTLAENARRLMERRTHCEKGHPFDDVNSYLAGGAHRICRTCRRDRAKGRRA